MASKEDAEPRGLVALKEGGGYFHFEGCNKLWREGGKVEPVKSYWSKGEAVRDGREFCPMCKRNEEKFRFRVKTATRPRPTAEMRPRERPFFSRYDNFYHYRESCSKWQKSLKTHKMLEKAFPIEYYEDRADAEDNFFKDPCPECAGRGDINVPG